MVLEQILADILPNIDLYFQLVRFLLVLGAGAIVTRTLMMPLASKIAERRTEEKVSIHSFSNLIGIFGLFLSFIIALQAGQFGNLVTVLGAITAALTVAVGFGMRDQVSNIVGGFFIYTDNPFVKGDYIKVGEQEGVVNEISLRRTIINGSASEKVVIPNSILTMNPVKNYTKGRKTKVSLELKVSPEKSQKLEDIGLKIVEKNQSILEKPEPELIYRSLSEDLLEYEFIFWIKDSKDSKIVKSEVLRDLTEKAKSEGIFEDKKEEK